MGDYSGIAGGAVGAAGTPINTTFNTSQPSTNNLSGLPYNRQASGLPEGISAPVSYGASANLTQTATNNKLVNPETIAPVNVSQNFNTDTLKNDIFSGIQSTVNESYGEGQKALDTKMANTGLFRSGLNLENQSNLEGQKMDALAKGWGDTALNVAQLEQNQAFKQADMDFDVSKYGADIQNAWAETNYDALLKATADDQAIINEASQFNINVKTAYDQLAYNYAKDLLTSEMQDRNNMMEYITNTGNTILGSNDVGAKNAWWNDVGGLLNDATNGASGYYRPSTSPFTYTEPATTYSSGSSSSSGDRDTVSQIADPAGIFSGGK